MTCGRKTGGDIGFERCELHLGTLLVGLFDIDDKMILEDRDFIGGPGV